jgi:hypothetical protein
MSVERKNVDFKSNWRSDWALQQAELNGQRPELHLTVQSPEVIGTMMSK